MLVTFVTTVEQLNSDFAYAATNMRITLRVCAALCFVWATFAGFVLLVPHAPPPMLEWWTSEAIKDADKILADSGEPSVLDGKQLTISRKSLMLVTRSAKRKDSISERREAETAFLVSSGFALVAGISLFLHTRKPRDNKLTAIPN